MTRWARRAEATTRIGIAALAGMAGVLAVSALLLADAFPPAPGGENFTWDSAKLIKSADAPRIATAQSEAFNLHDTPIVVATIYRMRDYSERPLTIEEFARRWFDHWGIGRAGSSRGILLLISEGDRQARIELGAAWGRGWDAHAQRIMNGKIIPAFKAGSYSRGIADGVTALAEMAAGGPRAEPPAPSFAERTASSETLKKLTSTSLLPRDLMIYMVIAGVLLIVASFFFPDYRKQLLIAGLALIGIAVFTYLVFIILGLLGRGRRGRSGGGFGGGGFGGGSSGGGGASGSW